MSEETKFVPASMIQPEIKDKLARKWLLDIVRAMIKVQTSIMQHLDLLKDAMFIYRDFLQKLELAISEAEGEL